MALGKLNGVLDTNIEKASSISSSNIGKIGGGSFSSYDSYTKLLLHMDGSNGSTIFTDSATSKSSTVIGGAEIMTSDGKFNQCGSFPSSPSKVTFADSPDWDFGTNDYTIDFWYKTTKSIYDHIIYRLTSYINIGISQYNSEFRLLISNLIDNDYIVLQNTSGCTADDGNWNHVALVRYGSGTDIYFNGDSKLHITTSYDITFSSNLIIGDADLVAMIDEVRISKGIARWTTTFTPPTAPY